MNNNDLRRFFTPNTKLWKIAANTNDQIIAYRSSEKKEEDKDKQLDHIINNSNDLLDFSISFTKTVVRLSFILFMVVNVFTISMIIINYFRMGEVNYLDILITESYGMLRDVIAAYIIKAATENSLKIAFSVLSEYLDRKYSIKPIKPVINDFDYTPNDSYENEEYDQSSNTEEDLTTDGDVEDIDEDEDPMSQDPFSDEIEMSLNGYSEAGIE